MKKSKTVLAFLDDNLISSRTPRDLAAFGEAMVRFLNKETRKA